MCSSAKHLGLADPLMAPLSVALISGKAVLENSDYQGIGLELRELVGKELRITPARLRLLTADNVEIADEETISESTKSPITAMVGEGQELPEWCAENMPHYSQKPLEDGLVLPDGASEIDPKTLGMVFAIAIHKAWKNAEKKFQKAMEKEGARSDEDFSYDLDKKSFYLDEWDGEDMTKHEKDIAAKLKDDWESSHQVVMQCKEAARSLALLDERLKGTQVLTYSRWEEDQTGRRRVYGIRQTYTAVEFDSIVGRPLERRGVFDKGASKSLKQLYRQRITTLIEVERLEDPGEVVDRVSTFCSLLKALSEGSPEAAWMAPHAALLDETLLLVLDREIFCLRATSGMACERFSREKSVEVLKGMCAAIMAVAGLSEKLSAGMLDALLQLASERSDGVHDIGRHLLMTYFPQEPRTRELLEEQAQHHWPHVRAKVKALLDGEESWPDQGEVNLKSSDQLPTPRSLYTKSLRKLPIRVPQISQPPRMSMRGDKVPNVLYDSGNEQSDSEEE
ncbi:unnamed protein product [Effrenium voratum]|uniref:Uncharacterized protein n=1 Tax=Effrenium voratum TaxID=2562239 RepID=A0AA36MQ20_9DINO|nr:unnamed protein product [Effrenium voratum]CAJ1419917.1 unnamed protein product [Effrenium voratum]